MHADFSQYTVLINEGPALYQRCYLFKSNIKALLLNLVMLDSYAQEHRTDECYRNKRQKTRYSTGTAPHKRAGCHVGLRGLTKSFDLSSISMEITYSVAFEACFGRAIVFTCWPLTLTNWLLQLAGFSSFQLVLTLQAISPWRSSHTCPDTDTDRIHRPGKQ